MTTQYTWRGRPLADLTREELEAALGKLIALMEQERNFHMEADRLERAFATTQSTFGRRS